MSAVTLDDFCRHLVDGEPPNERLHPTGVAREFVGFFGLSPFPHMDETESLLNRAVIATVVRSHDMAGLRGYHTGTNIGSYQIVIDATDGIVAQEHTVLHETYEIIKERLGDLYTDIGVPQGKSMCRQADRFAAAVLMQPYWFSLFATSSGLDIIALQKAYGRAYSSVILRLAEVMRDQPLIAVLYERGEAREPYFRTTAPVAHFRATVVARTPGFGARHSRALCGTKGGMPRWGKPLPPGSLAEGVALTGKPSYVEKETGFGDVAVAARPVFRRGRLKRIVVVAVPYNDCAVLMRQTADPSFESARRLAVAAGPW